MECLLPLFDECMVHAFREQVFGLNINVVALESSNVEGHDGDALFIDGLRVSENHSKLPLEMKKALARSTLAVFQ
ncbi:MAG: hypothetical protein ACFHW5_12720 [Verrucomicrobiota bacterium]|jgi:hypothetical protein